LHFERRRRISRGAQTFLIGHDEQDGFSGCRARFERTLVESLTIAIRFSESSCGASIARPGSNFEFGKLTAEARSRLTLASLMAGTIDRN
jgi:hypothetical protein